MSRTEPFAEETAKKLRGKNYNTKIDESEALPRTTQKIEGAIKKHN